MTAFLRIDELPELDTVPDDALIAVWAANRLWAAPRSAVGSGGGGGSGYRTIQNNGVDLTQRSTLNVAGLLQVSDVGGKTLLTLPAIALASQVSGTLPLGNMPITGSALQALRLNAGATAIEGYTPGAGLNAPVNPADNGKPAIASGGNLIYSLLTAAHLSASAAIATTQLASMGAARLLGRDSGSGTPVEIALSGGVEFTGSGSVERSALTGAISAPAGSNATSFASGAFGALGVSSNNFFSFGASPASAGAYRMGNTDALVGKTTLGVNVSIAAVSAGDTLGIGDTNVPIVVTGSGSATLRVGGSNILQALATTVRLLTPSLSFDVSAVAPSIIQSTDTTASVTCDDLIIAAQSGSGGTSVQAGSLGLKGGSATGVSGTRNGGACYLQPGTGATANGYSELRNAAGAGLVRCDSTGIGFNGSTPIAKPTVTGLKAGNAALASLLTALASYGLIIDSSGA